MLPKYSPGLKVTVWPGALMIVPPQKTGVWLIVLVTVIVGRAASGFPATGQAGGATVPEPDGSGKLANGSATAVVIFTGLAARKPGTARVPPKVMMLFVPTS